MKENIMSRENESSKNNKNTHKRTGQDTKHNRVEKGIKNKNYDNQRPTVGLDTHGGGLPA